MSDQQKSIIMQCQRGHKLAPKIELIHANSKRRPGEPGRHIRRYLCPECSGAIKVEIFTVMDREAMKTRSTCSILFVPPNEYELAQAEENWSNLPGISS